MSEIPDWLPVWREQVQYPEHGKHMHSWAWEFLRRNAAYWKDWEFHKSNSDKYCFNRDLCDLREPGDLREGDTSSAPLAVALAKEWGLTLSIIDPAANDGLFAFETYPSVQELPYLEIEGEPAPATGRPESWEEYGLIFKLNVPSFEPQLRYAKSSLEQQRDYLVREGKIEFVKTKPEHKLYQDYLRCFDARLAGITYREISQVLVPYKDEYPNYETVKNYQNAALKLVNGGYRLLPAHSNPPK